MSTHLCFNCEMKTFKRRFGVQGIVFGMLFFTPAIALALTVRDNPDIAAIITAENAYNQTHSGYFQILEHKQFPAGTPTSTKEYISLDALTDTTSVTPYEAPQGFGYQIFWSILPTLCATGSAHSLGFGPEANNRTYSSEFPKLIPNIASSTSATSSLSTRFTTIKLDIQCRTQTISTRFSSRR